MTTELKALTVWNPWAAMIAWGYKTVENRDWSTPYRGWVAIHSAREEAWDHAAETHPLVTGAWADLCERQHLQFSYAGAPPGPIPLASAPVIPGVMPAGAIVAVARLAECHLDAECWNVSDQGKVSYCDPWAGRDTWHWVFTDVRRLTAPLLGVRGYQRLWPVKPDVAAAVAVLDDRLAA